MQTGIHNQSTSIRLMSIACIICKQSNNKPHIKLCKRITVYACICVCVWVRESEFVRIFSNGIVQWSYHLNSVIIKVFAHTITRTQSENIHRINAHTHIYNCDCRLSHIRIVIHIHFNFWWERKIISLWDQSIR